MPRWQRTRPYWIPLLFVFALAVAGWATGRAVERAARIAVATQLETTLAAHATAVDVWLSGQKAVALDLATDPEVRAAVARLSAEYGRRGRAALVDPAARAALDAVVEPVLDHHGYPAWRLFDVDLVCLAGSDEHALGRVVVADRMNETLVLEGDTVVTPPLVGDSEDLRAAPQGVMAILTRVDDASGRPIGLLALGVDAASTFSRLLEVARLGATGETYAFSREGMLLSPSRFEDELRRIGLLDDAPDSRSFMRVHLRDPGGDLTAGFVTSTPLLARPLTRMAASAVMGESGMDLDGYRDYRGVVVVGAWRWIEPLRLGIATEIDRDEAFAALAPVRRWTAGLIGLLGFAALGLFVYSVAMRRVQGDLVVARRLGRYRIESVLGRGGMGIVYRARHALLRRPTAVKVLRPEHTSQAAIARFEREVQTTSELTHPNTIEIYDYGETPDGLFYYAMEYLDGATLREIVDRTGAMPDARALAILRQLCGSIAEAHRVGLVHRDIKPSNVMLCDRGGLLDFVKVLDFGLVKPMTGADPRITDVRAMTGTPLYMPPEVIRSADALGPRSDVYQIGAVGWFLLAGRPLFEGRTAVELLEQHLNVAPRAPSAVADVRVDAAFEALILACLAKDPGERPADAGVLLSALASIHPISEWSEADAARFWESWRAQPPAVDVRSEDSAEIRSGDSLDMAPRLGDAARP